MIVLIEKERAQGFPFERNHLITLVHAIEVVAVNLWFNPSTLPVWVVSHIEPCRKILAVIHVYLRCDHFIHPIFLVKHEKAHIQVHVEIVGYRLRILVTEPVEMHVLSNLLDKLHVRLHIAGWVAIERLTPTDAVTSLVVLVGDATCLIRFRLAHFW